MSVNPVTLDAIVERVMRDPIGFLERMLQEALDKLARDGTFSSNGDRPPEELVATALGRRLGKVIAVEAADDTPPTSGWGQGADEPPIDVVVMEDHEQLVERNGALAAAVGACDCFGQHEECPICEGHGGPGWVPPDKELFATYVYPAVRLVSRRARESSDDDVDRRLRDGPRSLR